MLNDAAGTFCDVVCDECVSKKMKRYNPHVFERGTRYAKTGEEQDIP